ncbi:MAG: 5-(carboxyamino)imidazole ribonucleotide synthase [Pseudomonadota bacterium]
MTRAPAETTGLGAPLPPGSRIGILGGGQLGRMLAVAAHRLGLRTGIYSDVLDAPAVQVTDRHWIGAYDDARQLRAFAAACDAVTFEFENIPAATIEAVSELTPVRPGARAIERTQDRLAERKLLDELQIPVAPYRNVDSEADLTASAGALGVPLILKTRRFGYDGKGQARIIDHAAVPAEYSAIARQPAIVEQKIPFLREVSQIVVRGLDGALAFYPLCENTHRDGILHRTVAPATADDELSAAARDAAGAVAEALEFVGTLTVEFFVVEGSGSARLIANEIAPRVHNSGHWTLEGAVTDQFENHIRAVAGWPLGACEARGSWEMRNLIGEDANEWHSLSAQAGAHLHLYGKADARPGRKMGHVTRAL